MNKKFWIPLIVLFVLGAYGLSQTFFSSSKGTSDQEIEVSIESKDIDKAETATTSVARDLLLDSEDEIELKDVSKKSLEESIVESQREEEPASYELSITEAEDDEAARAFYEEQARDDNSESFARLVERANRDEKYLILDDGSSAASTSDPEEFARIDRLREHAEEAEKLLPLILGEEEYTTKDTKKIEQLRKRADEAEKFLPPLDD